MPWGVARLLRLHGLLPCPHPLGEVRSTAKEVVANFMRKEAEKELTKLNEKPNSIFTLVKFIEKDGKDIEGGRCMRGKSKRLGFSEKDRKKYGKIT